MGSSPDSPDRRSRAFRGVPSSVAAGLLLAGCLGCGLLPSSMQLAPKLLGDGEEIDAAVYQRAESDRAERLEKEVERLRADLRQAEEALVSAESGLLGDHTRVDAVSSLAEARIQVERVARRAPWAGAPIEEARGKLDDADAQIDRGNFGAAIFFVYRARRIARDLEREADRFAATQTARFVRGQRVNLRSGPSTDTEVLHVLMGGTPVFTERLGETWALVRTMSGQVGWVHKSLLE